MPDHSLTSHRSIPGKQRPEPRLIPRADGASTRLATIAARVWRATRSALVVYAGAMALHLAVLAYKIPSGGPSLTDELTGWDGQRYIQIASQGYPHGFTYAPDGQLLGTNLAFFPLYPLLIRAVHTVTGIDWPMAAILTAHLATITALILIHRLMCQLYTERIATIVLVLLAAAQPISIAFFMAYSESLFLALAAGTLLAARHRAWLTAGLCAFAAGLTRPTGAAVIVALALAALLELRRERRLAWRPVAATVLAGTSIPLYLWWVANRVGQADAWFTIQQAGWGTQWDWGTSFWQFLSRILRAGDDWVLLSMTFLLLGTLLAAMPVVLRPRRSRVWPPLLAYGVMIIVLTLGQSNYYHSKLRLLTPALIVLIPAATALARATRTSRILILAPAALFGCSYGAFMLTTWYSSI